METRLNTICDFKAKKEQIMGQLVSKGEFIEKAIKWIKENSEWYIECEDRFYAGWLTEDFYNEFRKAMEE